MLSGQSFTVVSILDRCPNSVGGYYIYWHSNKVIIIIIIIIIIMSHTYRWPCFPKAILLLLLLIFRWQEAPHFPKG